MRSASPVTNAEPASGGNIPGAPRPLAWWHAAQVPAKTAAPFTGWAAAPPPARAAIIAAGPTGACTALSPWKSPVYRPM